MRMHIIDHVEGGIPSVALAHLRLAPLSFTPIFDQIPAVEKLSTSTTRDRYGTTWRWHQRCFLELGVSPEWRKCDPGRSVPKRSGYFNVYVQKTFSARSSDMGSVDLTPAQGPIISSNPRTKPIRFKEKWDPLHQPLPSFPSGRRLFSSLWLWENGACNIVLFR